MYTDEIDTILFSLNARGNLINFLKEYLLNCILYGRGPSQNYIKYFSQVYSKETFIPNLKKGKDYILCQTGEVNEVTNRFVELGILKYYLEAK